jgi:hypothetical protein
MYAYAVDRQLSELSVLRNPQYSSYRTNAAYGASIGQN